MQQVFKSQISQIQDMSWEEFEKTLPPMFNNFMFKGMIKANFEKMKANPEMLA